MPTWAVAVWVKVVVWVDCRDGRRACNAVRWGVAARSFVPTARSRSSLHLPNKPGMLLTLAALGVEMVAGQAWGPASLMASRCRRLGC